MTRLAALLACALLPLAGQTANTPARELSLMVGKSLVVNTTVPLERVSVGYGEIAEATPVGPHEVLVNAKAPGETTLIVWQKGGGKLFFDVLVRPNPAAEEKRLEGLRRQLRTELADQPVTASLEDGNVFLRGTVRDLAAAERAAAIAATAGRVVNLLYVAVPPTDQQILLKVRFATVDRNASSELGMNLLSTGAANTIGRMTTQQFNPPRLDVTPTDTNLTLGDALNIFMFRRDLNLAATIKALEIRGLFELLAEPNLLAINGQQASFVAGGEFPYPILQGGGLGLGAVTIAFREFGIRIAFIPTVTPRGTIRLEVAPEVSALDFTNGLVFQGFSIPGLTLRRVHTAIELEPGQSFAIGGLLDRRLTETIEKIPLLANIPLLGKLFQSRSLSKQNNELLVIVSPELVRPIPSGQPAPQLPLPYPLMGPEVETRTPGLAATGTAPAQPPPPAIPIEKLIQSQRAEQANRLKTDAPAGNGSQAGTWPGGSPGSPAPPK